MKHEPTATTMAGIYKLLDMELNDLNAVDVREADREFCLLCETMDGIRDEIGDALMNMQYAGEILKGGVTEPTQLHGEFTEIYRTAIRIAGKAVRLAAATRKGIIQSETMKPIDRGEEQKGGEHGKTV